MDYTSIVRQLVQHQTDPSFGGQVGHSGGNFIVYPLVEITSNNAIMSKKKSQDKSEVKQIQAMPLKEIRQDMSMNQEQLAVALGVSTSKISSAERGLSEPVFTIKQVKHLCKLAKKSLDEMPDYLGKDFLDFGE